MSSLLRVPRGPAARIALGIGALWVFLPSSLLAGENGKPVRIGVLAIRGPENCLERWGPTAEYLDERLPGYSFVIQPLAYDQVSPVVEREEVEFVLANPSLYIELEERFGASRIVTLKNEFMGKACTTYAGVIFHRAARKDIKSLRDLEGMDFVAVEKESFGGWQMAWRELKENGIDPYRDFAHLRFAGTQDAVVYAVQDGKADAGTVRTGVLERMENEGKIRLEEFTVIDVYKDGNIPSPLLHSTRFYPESPLAKVRHTPDELAEKVAVALISMPADSPAAKEAGCAGWTIPHNYQQVHECLKALRIGPYQDYGKLTPGAVIRRYWAWLVVAAGLLVVTSFAAVYVAQLNRKLRHALLGQQREMADRLQAEEALHKSEQLRVASEKLAAVGRLAAGVAHELNNPLTSVLTFSHLLRAKENLDEQDKQDLDLIIRETERAGQIVHGLLDFSRERAPLAEQLDINEVIRRTVRLLGSQEAFQTITLQEDFAENLPHVEGDANQLEQVLLNLILNACEAMSGGGLLAIRTSNRDQQVLVQVSDNGCGIKKEHLDQIFEPFFTTKDVGKGTGLGLSVSYGIVQEHGGTIDVESEEGKGSTFTVVLPAAAS